MKTEHEASAKIAFKLVLLINQSTRSKFVRVLTKMVQYEKVFSEAVRQFPVIYDKG